MRTLVITALVVLSVGGSAAGAVGYLIQALRQDRIARAKAEAGLTNAVPAPETARVPARAAAQEKRAAAVLLCATNGHVTPDWARLDGRHVCTRCGRLLPKDGDLPFDREAAELVVETEQWLRRSAS